LTSRPVQRSNQTATGGVVTGFTNFGMAWYQSDITTSASGTASVTIKTILVDQIFGFDPDVALAPTRSRAGRRSAASRNTARGRLKKLDEAS